MNSAPAVLRTPAVVAEATPVSTPEMLESYPWAVQTPETSPRCWDKLPCFEAQVPVKPMVSRDSLQSACMPSFEQMCHSVESNIFAYQLTAEGALSHELLRKMCEPFFEQMTTAMQQTAQQTLQQNAQQTTQLSLATCQPCQPTIDSGIYFQAPTLYRRFDEESTEAEDSCAFASLLSGASSDVDPLDAIDRKSEGSDVAGDADKNIMVCRHWKSKGWCRMESNCKFLHPEHKRGISKTEGEGAAAASTSLRRKKRGGKNRSTKAQPAQLGNEGQNVVGALS